MEYEGNLFWKKDFFSFAETGHHRSFSRKIKRGREKEVQVFKESSRKKKKEITELELNCIKASTSKFLQVFLIFKKVNETVSQYALSPIPRFLVCPIYRR